MKTYSEYIWLKRQLAEMEEVLRLNIDSPKSQNEKVS